MGHTKSTATGTSGGAARTGQAEDAVPHRWSGIQLVQNVLLIWLDNNIDENSADCRNTINHLRCAVDTIKTFSNTDQCIQFLETIKNEKVYMIISGSLGQHIVPCVHNMRQVDSIFIFCGNKKYHEQWTKKWSKIKGVFTEIAPISKVLKQATQQCEQNAISISFIDTSGDNSKKNLGQLDLSFMYTQILKEILLVIKFEPKHFTEFIEYCREVFDKNQWELNNVDKLQRTYRDQTPIWWYTYECFLYPMLNRAIRQMDVDIIIKMGFFIGDLHRHIEQLRKEQFGGKHSGKTFTVYRGQSISNTAFEEMSKIKGELISFNNFLSTSKNRNVSLGFASRVVSNNDLVGILFVMTIDPSQSTTPSASIIDVSYFKDEEDEVLFAMHTIFRICEIKPMNENHRLFQVELTLTSDNDQDLRVLTDSIREETFPYSKGWYRLGSILLKLGQSDKAEEVYQILLKQTSEKSEKARIYNQLWRANDNLGKYKEAITFYEKALEIRQQSLPPNHPGLPKSYNNIGLVCSNMGEYSKALSYYEKSLEIDKKHFFRIILIWVLPIMTWVLCMTT